MLRVGLDAAVQHVGPVVDVVGEEDVEAFDLHLSVAGTVPRLVQVQLLGRVGHGGSGGSAWCGGPSWRGRGEDVRDHQEE